MNEKKERTLEEQLFCIGLIALPAAMVFAGIYLVLTKYFLPQIPCFFSLIGLYCPGCGGTRALAALVQGKILLAIWYHPLVPYGVFLYLGFMISQGLHRLGVKKIKGWKFHIGFLWGALIILVVNFFVKNILRVCFGILM